MRVRGKNFLSIAEIDLTLPAGVTLIQGHNYDDDTSEGSGKSAIPSLIFWTLTGEMPKDVNIDEVIKEGTKHCEGLVDLEDFSVFRSRGPNDLHIKEKDGRTYRGKDAIETQKEIIRRLGMSFKTICQSVYFAQNYPNKFVTANQENKGKILSEILNLDQFDRARKTAADRIKPLKEQQIEVEKQVIAAQVRVDAEAKNIASFEQLIQEFQVQKVAKIQKLVEEYERIQAEADTFLVEFRAEQKAQIDKTQSKIHELKKEVKKLEGKKSALEKIAGTEVDFEAAIRELEENSGAIASENNTTKVKIATLESENKAQRKREKTVAQGEKELSEIEQELARIAELQAEAVPHSVECLAGLERAERAQQNPSKEICPTCGQPWDGDPKHYEKEVKVAKAALTRAEKALVDLKERRKVQKAQKKSLLKEIETLKLEMSEFEPRNLETLQESLKAGTEALDKITYAIAKLREQDRTARDAVSEARLLSVQIENITNEINETEKDLEETRKASPEPQIRKFEARKEDLVDEVEAEDRKEPDTLQAKLRTAQVVHAATSDKWEEASQAVDSLKLHIDRLERLREGFREVKAYTFENTLRLLNAKANRYLAQLFNQKVKIQFRNEDLKIATTVEINGQERVLELYSGGQFRRIAIAVDLALADVTLARKGNRINLLVLDEICKDLSLTSMKRVLKILQARKTPTLLIEHNDLFKSIVTSTINVELRNGTSTVTG